MYLNMVKEETEMTNLNDITAQKRDYLLQVGSSPEASQIFSTL